MTGLRVCAVIVTFNRMDDLKRCVQAVQGQSRRPAQVLVVDNGSIDGTATYLAEAVARHAGLSSLALGENLGPAGGFAAGLAAAVADGCSHVWAMDDDVLPDLSCLEKLAAWAENEGSDLLFPAVVDRAGRATRHPGWSGVLISADAIRRAGVPNRDLFWWIEDTEYLQWRLPRVHGIAAARCSEARVEHGAERTGPKPPWKLYYEVRNTIFYRLHVQTTSWRRRASRVVVVLSKALARTLLLEDRKGKKLVYIARGVCDGLIGRLGKIVDPAM